MTTLRIETWTMPAADLGPDNPLPPLATNRDLHVVTDTAEIPADMVENIRYGHIPNIMPYTIQDGYTRHRQPKPIKAAVLENDILKATFLLDYGARLWSLYHKPQKRELLSTNPIFQPANLALRNAWFSGGVEWNTGTTGHTPLTCSPLFAARVVGPAESPILRLYEWERIRQITYQIDVWLPDGSPMLLVHIRIVNPHEYDVPVYWWSNIAVPETEQTRVLVPAESAYKFDYRCKIDVVPVPHYEGRDVTYTTTSPHAMDFFFHIPDDRQPWITALDENGSGLIQVSTARLRGRKLFMWGMGKGGRNWQRFLSDSGDPYLEIQAGLARTQLEHLRMPAGAEWRWLEAYGLMQADSAVVHAVDWRQAQREVENRLGTMMAEASFEQAFAQFEGWQELPPAEMLHRGSGWGALERKRREDTGEKPFCSSALIFPDDSLTEPQLPWLSLLQHGNFPAYFDSAHPAFMVQDEWMHLLEDSLHRGSSDNWAAWFHLGNVYLYHGDETGAKAAWERSLEQQGNPWAVRNLAVLAREQPDEAAAHYLRALAQLPHSPALLIETGQSLLRADRPRQWLDIFDQLPDDLQSHGRIRLIEARAALMTGDLPRVERFFAEQVQIADLREGEDSLADLWIEFIRRKYPALKDTQQILAAHPVPQHADFRMSGG